MRLIFDLESDGYVEQLTRLHVIAAMDIDTKVEYVFGPDNIDEGVELLQSASMICGHNVLCFDIPAIQKLYPDFNTDKMIVRDTLVMSRLIHADLKREDFERGWTHERMPRKFYGSHSLKSWGYRLGVFKGSFADNTDWQNWSLEMQQYCQRDVAVTHRLWEALASQQWPEKSIDFEHRIAAICHDVGNAGWTFDMDKAGALYAQLALERSSLEENMHQLFPPWTVSEEFVPKRNNRKLGYVAGEVFLKEREVEFNPNSRRHIEHCLRAKYGWTPKEFTANGDAKVDEAVLSKLAFPEAKALARIFMLRKRIGQLAEGRNAWLRLVDTGGKLRHTINPNGTVSGRCSSHHPNLQQVPSTRAEFGPECRQLFKPAQGYKLLTADLSGLELRCLAHYLEDDRAFANEILKGDIHQANADAAGITRDQGKTMIYALCFNAGDRRLGEILGKGPKEGRALRDKFYKANPAFAELLRQVKLIANKRGYLIGLDGRRLPVRSDHGALNLLLQSAGAMIAKKWLELVRNALVEQEVDGQIIAFVHDEISIQMKGDCDHVGNNIAIAMARKAGEAFSFRCPIDAEFSIGPSWAETH